jgi:hypothetical protein
MQASQCLGLQASQPCSGGGGPATCGHLARDPGQRQDGFGFAIAGSDQALEPSYVRIQCRITGLTDRDGGVGVIPLGQLLVAQVMEQPGGVTGRLTSDGSETAPQQPVLGAPKQPDHPAQVPSYRVHQLKRAQVVIQPPVRRRDRLKVLDRGPVDPGRMPNRQREPIQLIRTAEVEDGLHGGGAEQGRDLTHELPAGSHVEYVLLEPELNHALYMMAMVQVRRPSAGQAYYQRKLAEGKSAKEALRCLKLRLSDAIYRCLLADSPGRVGHQQLIPG